jgi:hypothetical protein
LKDWWPERSTGVWRIPAFDKPEAFATELGIKRTLQSKLVPLQGSDGLPEKLLGMLVAGVNTRDVHLFPLDWDVVCLEDLLHGVGNFGTNTVTWNQSQPRIRSEALIRDRLTWDEGNGVLATELGWLEDVLLDGGQSYHTRQLQGNSSRQ